MNQNVIESFIKCTIVDILINFDDRATLARSDIGGEYWTLQTGPCSTRPSGMPMVPVLIHCRVVRIYLDAGASVSDAWVARTQTRAT